jgi:pimeloyl-ACP methyl ester carboxylesterase
MTDIRPFRISVPDEALADLRGRIARTRWPDEINDEDWSYGAKGDWLQGALDYWADGYDWRAQEAAINVIPQFKARIDGREIHFLHLKGRGPNPRPLLIAHGWPGSFVEMLEMAPMLADPGAYGGDPADAFDVIVPSMPGYGFSDRPNRPGMTPRRIAALYAELMERLGYQRYGVQGGDWGATVSTWLALDFADRVSAIHLNWVPGSLQPSLETPLTAEEQAFLDHMRANIATISSHTVIHAAKPQTLAYGLNDSPAGIAAWLLDKFRMISDCDGNLTSVYTLDALLTNVSVYWFSQTIGSSIRLYREAQGCPVALAAGERIRPPLSYALFPGEVALPPRSWLERAYDVRRWTVMEKGGHFGAMEQPAALAADIRAYFSSLG